MACSASEEVASPKHPAKNRPITSPMMGLGAKRRMNVGMIADALQNLQVGATFWRKSRPKQSRA